LISFALGYAIAAWRSWHVAEVQDVRNALAITG